MTSLCRAVVTKDFAALKRLVHRGADVNATGYIADDRVQIMREEPPLITAARFGHIHMVHFLLEQGAEVSMCVEGVGMTALHWACAKGNVEMVRLLLRFRANVNQSNYYYETPLMEAVCSSDLRVIRLLVLNSVDLNRPVNSSHDSPVLFALQTREIAIMRLLIGAGADIHKSNNFGEDMVKCMASLIASMTSLPGGETLDQLLRYLLDIGCRVNVRHIGVYQQLDTPSSQDYVDLLREAKRTPYPLRHLCRQCVRTCLLKLTDSFCILRRIRSLPIPLAIQNYVAMDVDVRDIDDV